ncbi:MAG TPA: hypothetical protein VKQ36_02685 [Ktedonobacterales bacterium]|nr:hypothetical protein [Ktedonobacterales bacterium]
METITITMPDALYHRLERVAELTHQPLEGVIMKTLSATLPLLPDDLPPATRDALQALESLDDEMLQEQARATLPTGQYKQLTALRDKRRDGTLSPKDEEKLEQLLQAADLLTLKKAYATVLLKWRGRRLSVPSASF